MEYERIPAAVAAKIEKLLLLEGEPTEHLELIQTIQSNEKLLIQFEYLRNTVMPDMAGESRDDSLRALAQLAEARLEGVESVASLANKIASQDWLIAAAKEVLERIRIGAAVK